ncbi:MAG: hypothetical protein WBO97_08915 [Tepidiformaceae bacterium]
MTKLIIEALAKISELDDVEQDRLAQMILDDIESEQNWATLFNGSQDALANLAAEARAEFEAGLTDELPLDTL